MRFEPARAALCWVGPGAHLLEGVQVAESPRIALADAAEDGDQLVLRAGRALRRGTVGDVLARVSCRLTDHHGMDGGTRWTMLTLALGDDQLALVLGGCGPCGRGS